jgi:hypothetical protein
VTQVSVDIPSKLTAELPPHDGDVEYRLRWNQLSAHTSFSRVVPDIDSMHLPNPWSFRNQLSYKDSSGASFDDLTNIWRATTYNNKLYSNPAVVLPINKHAVDAAALTKSRPAAGSTMPNQASPKCYFHRLAGAREREVRRYSCGVCAARGCPWVLC